MARISVTAKNFAPKVLSSNVVRGEILAEFQNRQGPRAVELANRTIRTWNDPPTFAFEFRFAGGDARLQLVARGTDKQIWKWIWLDEGTRVRRAKLSHPFYRKTHPGFLGSVQGQGHVVAINKKFNFPGIEARNWSEMMTKIMEGDFANDIQDAIDRGITKIGL